MRHFVEVKTSRGIIRKEFPSRAHAELFVIGMNYNSFYLPEGVERPQIRVMQEESNARIVEVHKNHVAE